MGFQSNDKKKNQLNDKKIQSNENFFQPNDKKISKMTKIISKNNGKSNSDKESKQSTIKFRKIRAHCVLVTRHSGTEYLIFFFYLKTTLTPNVSYLDRKVTTCLEY